MEKELKDQVVIYGVWHARRRKFEDKTRFLKGLSMDFEELGMPVSLLEYPADRTRDLIVGDLKKAKVCIVTHYDTPKNLMPGFFHLFPFDRKQTALYAKRAENARLYFSTLAGLLPIAAGIVCYIRQMPLWSVLLCGVLAALGIGWLIYALKGNDNRRNFNENNMATVVALRAAAGMDEELRRKVAFIFLDNYYDGFKGEKLLIGQYGSLLARRHGVVLEAVAGGDKLFIGGSIPQRNWMARTASHPDDMEIYDRPVENIGSAFASCIKLCTGRRVGENVVVDGTRTFRDSDYDPEWLECISRMLVEYTRKIASDS